MSHEDWDLFAIVRSCKATNFTTPSTTTTQTPPTNTRSPHQNTTKLEPLQPNIVQPKTNGFLELHQLLVNNFNPTTTTTTTTIATTSTSGCGINPYSTTFSDLTGVQHKMQQQGLTNFTSFGASTTSFDRFHHQQQQKPQPTEQHQQQQQEQQQQEAINQQPLQVIPQTNYMVLQNTQPQTPRSRKRKSQQKKMVCHVTADNLSADLWAWRKYGQKPIKGSPYPRNYYRCSSSKGCAARKQVERSTTDPNMFIVTYTGDHKHAKPVHRNSLAGSTRNKPSMTHLPAATETGSPQNAGSSSSTVLRPGSPENGEPECPDPDLRPDGDDVLIPNMAVVSDAFLLGLNHFDSDAKPSDGSDPNSVPGFDPNILSGPGLQEV